MIDIESAKSEFEKYAKKYNLEIERLNRKYNHTFRVMNNAGKIAESLDLNEDEIQLALIIGLLHDISRFEQYKRFQTLSDVKSIDHGDFGVQILEENDFLRKFVKDSLYDEIIFKAVKNHNKFKIEEDLTDKELLYAKIVRDADKIDILFEILTMFYKDPNDIDALENGKITEDVIKQVRNKKQIKRKKEHNKIDILITMLCYTFDLNYKYSFNLVFKKDYINKIIDRFDFKNTDTKEQMEEIRQILNNYIQENKG